MFCGFLLHIRQVSCLHFIFLVGFSFIKNDRPTITPGLYQKHSDDVLNFLSLKFSG